jgi:hypothetical protein
MKNTPSNCASPNHCWTEEARRTNLLPALARNQTPMDAARQTTHLQLQVWASHPSVGIGVSNKAWAGSSADVGA